MYSTRSTNEKEVGMEVGPPSLVETKSQQKRMQSDGSNP